MVSDQLTNMASIQYLLQDIDLSFDEVPALHDWQLVLRALRQREKQVDILRRTAIDIPDALVFIFDLKMRIIACNRYAANMLGFRHEDQLVGKDARTFLDPSDFAASMRRFERVLNGEVIPEYERVLNHPNGNTITTRVQLSVIESDLSDERYVKSVMFDVTSLKKAEQRAERNQHYLEVVLNHAPIVLWACDMNGDITLSHGMGLEGVGRESNELVGSNIYQMYDRGNEMLIAVERAMSSEEQQIQTTTDNRIFDTRIRPLMDDGTQIGVTGVSMDITELTRARQTIQIVEESTRRTRDYLAAIVNHSNDGIAVTDLYGIIEQTNPAFRELVQADNQQTFGLSLHDVLADDDLDMINQALLFVRNRHIPMRFEATLAHAGSPTPVFVDVSCAPILTDDGALQSLMFSLRDVTAYRELLARVVDARDEALQASKLKSEFLAVMSHEVRTPLHSIMGLTEMLQDITSDDEQSELLGIVADQSQHLLAMLNDILDYSKLEADKMILERRVVKLVDQVEAAAKPFVGQAWNKGIDIKLETTIADELLVYTDSKRLRQVFTILLSNALKFTETGEVIFRALSRHSTASTITIEFHVQDTGIGIADDQLADLFSPFVQADTSHSRKYGGTGLGLAIARRILKLMGSPLHVETQVGQGTQFSFTITFDMATVETL